MNPNNHGRALACALIVVPAILLSAQDVEASGFAIRENSTTGLGNAFASVPTNTDDITSISTNPAAMTYFTGIQGAASNSYIIPRAEFDGDSASTVGGFTINETNAFDGEDDIGRSALVGAFYTSAEVTDELRLGLAVTSPFGLLTDNSDGWIGRYHALKSSLLTIDVNPVVAYQVTDWLSIGGGFRAVYAEAELSNAIDSSGIASSGASAPNTILPDGRAELYGDDWGFGGNAGIMFEPGKLYAPLEGLRLGVGYRSRVELKVEGETDFEVPAALTGGGAFTDGTDTKAEVDLPESVSFGAHYDLNDQWAVMAQAEWTNWSEFEELLVEFDDNTPDSVTEEDWHDSWFFAVGMTHRPTWLEGLTIRTGFAYDQTPVPTRTRTPRIPDEDRYWLAFGVGYTPYSWLTLDLSYTHIFVPDAEIDLEAGDEGNTFRGNLDGEYRADIDIISFQGTIRF